MDVFSRIDSVCWGACTIVGLSARSNLRVPQLHRTRASRCSSSCARLVVHLRSPDAPVRRKILASKIRLKARTCFPYLSASLLPRLRPNEVRDEEPIQVAGETSSTRPLGLQAFADIIRPHIRCPWIPCQAPCMDSGFLHTRG